MGRQGDAGPNIDLGARHAVKRVSWPVFDEERETELRATLEAIGDQSSERERAAADAERELMDWRKADFMADRVGDEFDGVITGVKEYGLYVELNEFFIEGLVHISTLVDDVYDYQERKHRLVGQRGRREFRLGQKVRVAVNRVDRARHLIDFSLA
jgi:ribonuclease R